MKAGLLVVKKAVLMVVPLVCYWVAKKAVLMAGLKVVKKAVLTADLLVDHLVVKKADQKVVQ